MQSEPTEPRRRPGGRSARVRQAVLASALRHLLDVGYARLSIAEVAADAGVAESTVYRRWKSKPELIADALLQYAELHAPAPEAGTLEPDLVAWLSGIAKAVSSPEGTRLLRTLAALDDEAEGIREMRARFYGSRYRTFESIVARAAARGELDPAADARAIADLLVGAVYLRVLLTAGTVDDGQIARLVASTLKVNAAQGPPPTPGG